MVSLSIKDFQFGINNYCKYNVSDIEKYFPVIHAMKKIFGTIFFYLTINQMVQSQNNCQWSEHLDSLECGLRESGDQLLFLDNRTSEWTFGIYNSLSLDYSNVNITWWRVDLASVSEAVKLFYEKNRKFH